MLVAGNLTPSYAEAGDTWRAYVGDHRLLSLGDTVKIAKEIDLLGRLTVDGLADCNETIVFEDDIDRGWTATDWALLPSDNCSDYLLNDTFTPVVDQLPNVIEFLSRIEGLLGRRAEKLLVNRLSPNGRIGRHQDDALETPSLAVNLRGNAWFSVRDQGAMRLRRFRLGPGDAVLLFNATGNRPPHSVTALNNDRLSLAIA